MTFKKIFGASASLGVLLLASPALAVPFSVAPPPPTTYYTAQQAGMIGDGITDNAATFAAACTFAKAFNHELLIPDGVYEISAPVVCNANVMMTDNAILQASTPGMSAVVTVGDTSTLVKDTFWRGGVIDAHNNANDGMFIRNAAHYDVNGVFVTDQLNNAFNVGDPGTSVPSYEVHLFNIHVHRANDYWDSGLSCTIPSTSVGVFMNYVTDSRIILGEIVSQNIGMNIAKSSMAVEYIHAWPRTSCGNMTIAFKDSGVDNTYYGDHADTPSQYGWFFNSTIPNSELDRPHFTMNSATITGAIGVYFSQAANPYVTIKGAHFDDASSGGGFASDLNTTIGGGTANMNIVGTRYYPTTSVKGSKFLANNVVAGFSPTCIHGATVTTVLFGAGSSSWVVPACFTSLVKIEAIGAGGSVAAGNIIGGAGGGAYSAITSDANFVAGASLNFQLGTAGGAQGTGSGASGLGDTWFDSNTTLLAQGGQSTTTATGGNGGATAQGVGTVKFAGGIGGGSFSGGGGGASSGGPGGPGCNGGAGASSKGGAGAGSPGNGTCSNGASGSTGIGGSAGTGGSIGGQGWQSTSVLATYGVMGSHWNITTYGGLYGTGSGGGGGGGGSGQVAGGGGGCGGGGGGSGTLGSGTKIAAGGNGCVVITYVQ